MTRRDIARISVGAVLIVIGHETIQHYRSLLTTASGGTTFGLGVWWFLTGLGNIAGAVQAAIIRRAERRRRAILLDLAEHGPTYTLDLCKRLGRGPGSVYPDLGALERQGRIVGEWEHRDDDRPRRRMYRLASDDERMGAS